MKYYHIIIRYEKIIHMPNKLHYTITKDAVCRSVVIFSHYFLDFINHKTIILANNIRKAMKEKSRPKGNRQREEHLVEVLYVIIG